MSSAWEMDEGAYLSLSDEERKKVDSESITRLRFKMFRKDNALLEYITKEKTDKLDAAKLASAASNLFNVLTDERKEQVSPIILKLLTDADFTLPLEDKKE